MLKSTQAQQQAHTNEMSEERNHENEDMRWKDS